MTESAGHSAAERSPLVIRAEGAPAPSLAWAIALGIVLAMVTGTLQSTWLALRLHLLGELIWRPRDYVWMAPASYLAPFVVTAVLTWGVLRMAQRWWSTLPVARVVAGAVLFLSALGLSLLVPRLHAAAYVIVAAGVATRLSAALARETAPRLLRAALLLSGAITLLGGADRWRRARAESRAIAALPPAAADAPNVLLLILDTVRAQSLGMYGRPRETSPALDRWAADGVVFDRAYSTAPWTLPSHASIFTGREAEELGVDARTPLDRRFPTLAEALAASGYVTGAFVSNVYYAGHDSGLGRGFAHFDDYLTTWQQVLWSSTLAQTELVKGIVWSGGWRGVRSTLRRFDLTLNPLRYAHRKRAGDVASNFLAWERVRGSRPYFAFLNFFDAHAAYVPKPRYARALPSPATSLDRYEACIRGLDDDVDALLRQLQSRGALDNTIVVVTSDHGEYFGEHGREGHGNGLHDPVLRVPLFIRYPAIVPPGERVAAVVSLRDLPATVLALARAQGREGEPPLPGVSLAGRWSIDAGATPPPPVRASNTFAGDSRKAPADRRIERSVVNDSLHWLVGFDGTEELYRYRLDSLERTNLAADGRWRSAAAALRTLATPPVTR